MKRYLKLYWAFFKNCLIREMEFRSHFILNNVITFIWAIIVMMVFFFIYRYVDVVNGWTLEKMLLLTAVYFLVDRIFDSFFEINFGNFITIVNTGQLDLILVKPVNSQFVVSLRQFSFAMVFSNLTMLLTIIYLCQRYFWPISFLQIFTFIILILASVVITYSLWFMSLLPIFWWGRVDNIQHLFRPVHQLCRIPIDVTGKFRLFLTYVMPLAFVATIPAKSLIGNLSLGLVVYGVFAAAFLLWLSHRLWQFALKHYSSASS